MDVILIRLMKKLTVINYNIFKQNTVLIKANINFPEVLVQKMHINISLRNLPTDCNGPFFLSSVLSNINIQKYI